MGLENIELPRQADAPVMPPDNSERRADRRNPVIKSARLIFAQTGSVHNCLVLDEAKGGVLVDLGTMMKVPDDVTIQFTSGAAYHAQRRWAAGTKAGFGFTGAQIVSEDTAGRMARIADILHAHGLSAAITTLRTARFFDNDDLRRLAEDAEAAHARFEAALQGKSLI